MAWHAAAAAWAHRGRRPAWQRPRTDRPARPGGALRLRAYVWADQAARAARLQGAIALAQATDATALPLAAGDAADWVEHELAAPRAGVATVLVHSGARQYLPAATQQRIEATLRLAGERATPAAPLAWLRLEFFERGAPAELRLTNWPGGAERRVAMLPAHRVDRRQQLRATASCPRRRGSRRAALPWSRR